MRIVRDWNTPGFRLVEHGRDVGFIRGDTITFHGFSSADEAALAGSLAQHTLTRRDADSRTARAAEGDDQALHEDRHDLVPDGGITVSTRLEEPPDDWAFDVSLPHVDQLGVLAMARARVAWAALRGSGVTRRMRQFGSDDPFEARRSS